MILRAFPQINGANDPDRLSVSSLLGTVFGAEITIATSRELHLLRALEQWNPTRP